jgi:hypothetical protein
MNANQKPRHDSPLIKALLRNYASNLRRSWRNTPHAAFVDATIQLEALVMVGVALIFALIQIALTRTILPSLSLPFGNTKYTRGTIIMVAAGAVVLWFVDRKLKPYEFVPGADKAYDTPRDRIMVWVYYASGFVILVIGVVLSDFLKQLLPLAN